MRPRDLLLNAILAATAWAPTLSQSNSYSTPRFGIIGGLNRATLSRGMFENPSQRTGFAAGLMAVLPVVPRFGVQPELVFTMKGANSDAAGSAATAKVDYIELPVLARFEIPASARVKPFVYGGPAFAYRVSCSFEGISTEFVAPGGLATVESRVTCDSLAAVGRQASPGFNYNKTDVDGIIGGGFAFGMGGRTMTVSVRYDVGFVNFFNRNDSKNRVLSFMGTLEWPFHK